MVTDHGGGEAMFFIFGDGIRRFGIGWDLDASGHLVATPIGSSAVTVTTDPVAATNYHFHELRFDPANQTGTYWVDGTPIVTWAGQAGTFQNGIAQWGGSSSAGMGQMNFHSAEFEIIGDGVIAAYSAGFDGDPATAPSPTTQGWTRGPGGGPILEASTGKSGPQSGRMDELTERCDKPCRHSSRRPEPVLPAAYPVEQSCRFAMRVANPHRRSRARALRCLPLSFSALFAFFAVNGC